MERLKYVAGMTLKNPEVEYLYRYHERSQMEFVFQFLLRGSTDASRVVEGTPLYSTWNNKADKVDDTSIQKYNGRFHSRYKKFEYENCYGDDDYRNETYYVYCDNDNLILYKEVPLLMDDNAFKWKENTRYNAYEAVVSEGAFEYQCVVNADGNGKVIVRYVKCENFHRTRVTIAEFNVENAYNETLLDAIDNWKKEFKESIVA